MISSNKVYNKFIKYEKKRYLEDSDSWFGVGKISKKDKEIIFNNYYKVSHYRFLLNVKDLVYSENPFTFIKKGHGDDWGIEVYISFLIKEGLIKISKGKIIIKNNLFFNHIPKPLTESEARNKIEKKTKKKIKDNDSVVSFINQFKTFKVKSDLDQMPISQSSAVFSVKKIIDYIPLNKKFLFIGDDDFLSIFLSLIDKNIESVVIDADRNLLKVIDDIALKFNLKIKTYLADTRKRNKIKGDFVGFWCNPPCTEKGIKNFSNFGINHLSQSGGFVFIVHGNENIGNRAIFLQDYFSKKNLITLEGIKGKITYPYIKLHKEDEDNLIRMKRYFSEKEIKKNNRLSAGLWIFDYIPFKVKKVQTSDSIYDYL